MNVKIVDEKMTKGAAESPTKSVRTIANNETKPHH